jgi:hypothetical protein
MENQLYWKLAHICVIWQSLSGMKIKLYFVAHSKPPFSTHFDVDLTHSHRMEDSVVLFYRVYSTHSSVSERRRQAWMPLC